MTKYLVFTNEVGQEIDRRDITGSGMWAVSSFRKQIEDGNPEISDSHIIWVDEE